jgi:hypothetical protein
VLHHHRRRLRRLAVAHPPRSTGARCSSSAARGRGCAQSWGRGGRRRHAQVGSAGGGRERAAVL